MAMFPAIRGKVSRGTKDVGRSSGASIDDRLEIRPARTHTRILAAALSALQFAGLLPIPGAESSASAHFVWVRAVHSAPDACEAQVYFSEEIAAGSADLVDRIAGCTLSRRTADGASEKLSLRKVIHEEEGYLQAQIPAQEPCSLEASCLYGVFSRGDVPFLLHYYAKHLQAGSTAELSRLARAGGLLLDIVPAWDPRGLQLQVLWQGKPVAGAELHSFDPHGNEETHTSDHEGRVLLGEDGPGLYGVRTSYIEKERSGEHDGKPYHEVRHYGTLTLQLPPAASASATATVSAGDLLARARAARAVWEDFPGFTALVTIHMDGEMSEGNVRMDADGNVKLELSEPAAQDWALEQLEQLATHRIPNGDLGNEASYEDDDQDHPLGRKLRLKEDSMGSVYRVRDDVVTQVNRQTGDVRFTISVLDVARNAEGKYLPRTFTVSFWDAKTGAVRFHQTHHQQYLRVGRFDLPAQLMEVHSAPNDYRVRKIELRELRLLDAPAANP
jgi:hypothetical protein